MGSQIYGLFWVLGLVLFQSSCCAMIFTSATAPTINDYVLHGNSEGYLSAPDRTLDIGDAFTITIRGEGSPEGRVLVSLGITPLLTDTRGYSLISFSASPPEGLEVEEIESEFGEGQTINLRGEVQLIQQYLTTLQHTLHADTPPNETVFIGAVIESAGGFGNRASVVIHNTEEYPTPTPVPPTNPASSSNSAPSNVVPGAQGVTHREPHVMNFMVYDPDLFDEITVTLQVNKGTLTVSPADWAVVTGNGTGSLTIVGDLDTVNNTLLGADGSGLADGVIYHYTGDHLEPGASTSDTLTFTSRDHLGAVATNWVELHISHAMPPPDEPSQQQPTPDVPNQQG